MSDGDFKDHKRADLQACSENWQDLSQHGCENEFQIRSSGRVIDLLGVCCDPDLPIEKKWPSRSPFGQRLQWDAVYLSEQDELQVLLEDVKGQFCGSTADDLEAFFRDLFGVSRVNLVAIAPEKRVGCSVIFRRKE